jgi:hypothetical protein
VSIYRKVTSFLGLQELLWTFTFPSSVPACLLPCRSGVFGDAGIPQAVHPLKAADAIRENMWANSAKGAAPLASQKSSFEAGICSLPSRPAWPLA